MASKAVAMDGKLACSPAVKPLFAKTGRWADEDSDCETTWKRAAERREETEKEWKWYGRWRNRGGQAWQGCKYG